MDAILSRLDRIWVIPYWLDSYDSMRALKQYRHALEYNDQEVTPLVETQLLLRYLRVIPELPFKDPRWDDDEYTYDTLLRYFHQFQEKYSSIKGYKPQKYKSNLPRCGNCRMYDHFIRNRQAFARKAGESHFEYAYRTGILPNGDECLAYLNWVKHGREPRKVVKQLEDMLSALQLSISSASAK